MKKPIIILILSVLILAGLALWAFQGNLAGKTREIVEAGVVLVLVGFAGGGNPGKTSCRGG
jgi:hypothetical protein